MSGQQALTYAHGMAPSSRDAILTAARRRFAAHGFASATVRAIAADAGVDPALVIRHYGSKAGLFAEAVDIDLRIPDLRGVPVAEHGTRLVEHFLRRWDASTPEGEVLVTLLRSAVADQEIAKRMQTLVSRQLAPALRPLLADPDEALQRTALVATQMLGIALTRSVLRLPPVTRLPAQLVVDAVGPTIQRYLHEPLAR